MNNDVPPDLGRLLGRLTAVLEENGGYITDTALRAALSLDPAGYKALIGIAYRQRRVDRIAGYLVAPGRPRRQAGKARAA